jgi:hypothetical protein
MGKQRVLLVEQELPTLIPVYTDFIRYFDIKLMGLCILKNVLSISKGLPDVVNWRTDKGKKNQQDKRKRTRQTISYNYTSLKIPKG